jgi:hypothetical protein
MIDWDLLNAWVRLISATINLIAIPVLMFLSLRCANKGQYERATLFIAWAVFLKV